jgi:hypothetical protein
MRQASCARTTLARKFSLPVGWHGDAIMVALPLLIYGMVLVGAKL